jgi:hypothetical protein
MILRDAMAIGIRHSEVVLRLSIALFAKRSPQPHRSRVVATLRGCHAVFERSGSCRT